VTKTEIGNLITQAQTQLKDLVLKSYQLAAKMENILNNKSLYGSATVVATGQSIATEIDSLISTYGVSTYQIMNNFRYFDLKWLFPSSVNWLYGNNGTLNQMNMFLSLMTYGPGYNANGGLKVMAPFEQGRDATYNFYKPMYDELVTMYAKWNIDAKTNTWFDTNKNNMPGILCLFRVADSFSAKGLDFWSYFAKWGNSIMPIYYSIMGTGYNEAKAEKATVDAQIVSVKNNITDLTIKFNDAVDPVPIIVAEPPPVIVPTPIEPVVEVILPVVTQVVEVPSIEVIAQLPVVEDVTPIIENPIVELPKEAEVFEWPTEAEVSTPVEKVTVIEAQIPLEQTIAVAPKKSKTPYYLAAAASIAGLIFINRGN
jgi:hypothetical protein